MLDPLNDADWEKLRVRLEVFRKNKKPFEVSLVTADRIFAYIDDLRTRTTKAETKQAEAMGHVEQAAADRDAVSARAERLQKDVDLVRAEIKPPDQDVSDRAKIGAYVRLCRQFYPQQNS